MFASGEKKLSELTVQKSEIKRTLERQLVTHLSKNLKTHLSENKTPSVSQTLSLLSPDHHREVEVGC
jgi:hypothetical protein